MGYWYEIGMALVVIGTVLHWRRMSTGWRVATVTTIALSLVLVATRDAVWGVTPMRSWWIYLKAFLRGLIFPHWV